MKTIEQVVDQIRAWEMFAGESFCDYFLDAYSYHDEWIIFLKGKGFHEVVQKIEADVYILGDGTILPCTDQQLKFEPHTSARYDQGLDWEEDVYRKDVALWAEYILADADILQEFEEWLLENQR